MATVLITGNTFPVKDQLKALGGKWDAAGKGWAVPEEKAEEARGLVAGAKSAPPAAGPLAASQGLAPEPDQARVLAKVKYKGQDYFVIAESQAQNRCRICKMNGTGFWVDMADCERLKTYQPREFRGRKEYTTLGSIRRFVAGQKRLEESGAERCAACGKRNNHLVEDLEDGLRKCRGCADIPGD